MNVYDPTELLQICDKIVEDGELSFQEVYDLTDWLNKHPEDRKQWPGYLFVQTLKGAWEDGKLSAEEMRTIGRLLQQVRKEWGLRKLNLSVEKKPAAKTIALDLEVARLPTIDAEIRIKSMSASAQEYNVDLREPACTCPDFCSYRAQIAQGDLSRCCKHILQAYSRVMTDEGFPAWFGAFVEHGWKPHPKQKWTVVKFDEHPALISSAPIEWSSVFAVSENGEYDRFGYSVFENRWAYEMEPANSFRMAKAINKLTGSS